MSRLSFTLVIINARLLFFHYIYKMSLELGEHRVITGRGPASIAIGPEIIQPELKKSEFSRFVEDTVRRAYADLDGYHLHQAD